MAVTEAEDIILTDNTFTGNGDYPIYLTFLTGTFGSLNNNSGSGNAHDAIHLTGGFSQDTTLPVQPSYPYVLNASTGYFAIDAGVTLTLPAGSVVKIRSRKGLSVRGTLQSEGTSESPVHITSERDDSVGGDSNGDGDASTPRFGDWGAILVDGGTANLTHTMVRYGGYSTSNAALNLGNNSHATVIQSTISNSYSGIYVRPSGAGVAASLEVGQSVIEDNYYYGIQSYGQSGATDQITVTNSTIRNNGSSGISTGTSTNALISGNNIYRNGSYGVYASSTNPVRAENNWWGSDSGPAPYGSGNGINFRTCYDSVRRVYYICEYYVDADPWLGKGHWVTSQLGHSGPASRYQAYEADPVNTANGNYSYGYTDISIPTRGLPLGFARTYNSLTPDQGPVGWGWVHNWQFSLVEYADGSVFVTFGDGHGEKWTWTGSAYEGDPGVYGILVKNGDGTHDLTQKDRTHYHFDPSGRLLFVEDRDHNVTTLGYDIDGRLATITEPAGRILQLAYTSPVSTTLISRVTDPGGRTVDYAYSAAGDLETVTDVTGQVTSMTYDANHRMLSITDANGHTFVNNVYDANARVTEQYDALGNKWTFAYDEPDHKTIVTDPLARDTTYLYDAEWRLVTETDALNQSVSYAYDADGNRVSAIDKLGNDTLYAYDDRGNVLVITDTVGSETHTAYDVWNNPLTQADALGRVTTYAYDANSNLTQRTDALSNSTVWTYDAYGLPTSETDPRNYTSVLVHDAHGNLLNTTDALGNVSTYVYDVVGRQTTQTDALGRTTTYTYDAANRLLSAVEPLGRTTSYAYDSVGNRISVTDPHGNVSTFAYDAKDRLASTTNPLGQTAVTAYDSVDNQISVTDPLSHTTTFSYDVLNRLKTVSDALSHATAYAYDANGNRTGLTDANGNSTAYAYDTLNRLATVTDAESGSVAYGYDVVGNRVAMTDANGHVNVYAYDALNRLASETDPLGHATGYAYDANGNVTAKTKPDTNVINYAYDALNRLVGTIYTGGLNEYVYDAVGNRKVMTDTVGVSAYQYDALDRLTQYGGPTGVLTYTYDLNNNRTSITHPGGDVVTYAYDDADRLHTVTDWASRVTTYTYDAVGRQTNLSYPNGVEAVNAYDDADRLLSIVHTSPISGVIAAFTYTVDAVGNRLSMEDLEGTTSYQYDKLYRLTGVTYPDGEQVTYAYDPMGNRQSLLSSVKGSTSYSYDNGDRLLSYTDSGGTTSLAWDDNGYLASKGTAAYTFDPLDRLTQVVSDTTTVAFAYDADGTRLSKSVNGTATSYVQDVSAGLPVVLEETTGGQTTSYNFGLDLISQEMSSGDISFYHVDGLGSVRRMSVLSGSAAAAYAYDVFGSLRNVVGASTTFGFTGEQIDSEVGLVYLRARYYDPEMGRFLSLDRFPAVAGLTQTINRYTYAQNNPARHTDPSGNAWYDVLNAEKNGLNQLIRNVWNDTGVGDAIVDNTPVLGGLVDTAEGAQKYSKNYGRSLELITSEMTEEDQREFDSTYSAASEGFGEALAGANNTLMETPCTLFNPSCGITSFAPRAIAEPYNIIKHPFTWLLGKGLGTVIDPIYHIPSLYIEHQFQGFGGDYNVNRGSLRYGGGGGGMGYLPSNPK